MGTAIVAGSHPLGPLARRYPDGLVHQGIGAELIAARLHLDRDELDAFEVNEAFAPVPLAWAHEFGADQERLNPRGGAIALGHPLGASGVRLLGTLLNHLETTGGRYGLQTMCEGGGMANATIIERL